jgi:hypothetical protein
MRDNNFKYDVTSSGSREKSLRRYFCARNSWCISFLTFVFPWLLPFTARMGKIRKRHSNRGSNGHRRHHFFSDTREKRRTELTLHYNRINDDVFMYWLATIAVLRIDVGELPHSFMPLYTDVISIIKSPRRYHEAKCHLGDGYWHVNRILNDIEIREEDHNQKVALLIRTLSNDIMNSIHGQIEGRPCDLDTTIHQYNILTSPDPPWYNMDLIFDHYRNEAGHKHEELEVITSPDESRAVLRSGTGNMGTGTKDDMECLMQIVISHQGNMLPRLRALSTEGIQIIDMFNTILKTQLEPIVLHIEDGYLGGKCNFEYGFPRRA